MTIAAGTQAAQAWDKAAIQHRGASTKTNLPVSRALAEAWAAEPIPGGTGCCCEGPCQLLTSSPRRCQRAVCSSAPRLLLVVVASSLAEA